MKVAVIILAIAVAAVGFLYFQSEQRSRQASAQHAQALQVAQEQLTVTSNRAVTAEAQVVATKKQNEEQLAKLQESVAAVTADKQKADARTQELQGRLDTVEKDLADEKAKLTSVEDQRVKIVNRLNTVSNELTVAQQKYALLQKTHAATTAELESYKSKTVELEMEKTSLERQLNDLDSLRNQIRVVKNRLWEEHVADWKKRDTAAGIGGNAGVLMKNGQWQSGTSKPSS